MFSHNSEASEPCDKYAGNLCSGFGGSTVCWFCGWNRFSHQSELTFKLRDSRLDSEGNPSLPIESQGD